MSLGDPNEGDIGLMIFNFVHDHEFFRLKTITLIFYEKNC
jgi:hypothetical protein